MNTKNIFLLLILFNVSTFSYAQSSWEDDFENADFRGPYDFNKGENFTHLTSGGVDNSACIEIKVEKGEHYGGSMRYLYNDQWAYEPEEVYAEYSVYYDKSMGDAKYTTGGTCEYGGKAPGFTGTYDNKGWGTVPGHGIDGWSARGTISCDRGNYVKNKYYIYSTYGDYDNNENPVPYTQHDLDIMTHATDPAYHGIWWDEDGSFAGKQYGIGKVGQMQFDTWYHVKQYVKVNDVGQSNGILRAWVNGELACEITDLNFRRTNDLKIYGYWFNYYWGGKGVAPGVGYIKIDNFKTYTDDKPLAPVETITIEGTDTLVTGKRMQLSVNITPEDAAGHTVSWKSDNTDIAIVDSYGNVTAIAEGSVTITATANKKSTTFTITVKQSEFTNVALFKTAKASSDDGNAPANVVDADPNTRWSAENFPQWLEIDLGEIKKISKTEVICYQDRAYQFIVEAKATESDTYTKVLDRSDNTTAGKVSVPISDSFTETEARFVKLTVTGASGYDGSWASIAELRVFEKTATIPNKKKVIEEHSSVIVYPNPFTSTLNIDLQNKDFHTLKIVDPSGKILLTKSLNEKNKVELNLPYNRVPVGNYILQLTGKDCISTHKISRK